MSRERNTLEGFEELFSHAGWLRGLARSLVTDPQAADDLVQDTWIAALRNPPRHEVRPWLGRVLRNAARQLTRSDRRRIRRERAAAKHEALPSEQELADQMELQRALVECVLELREPYRSAVVLRFYEGLSASEIARRRELPGATVRSHLKRGLDELRRKLDSRYAGSRTEWMAAFLPWLSVQRPGGIPTTADPTAATSIAKGVLAMSMGIKFVIGASAITLVVAGYRFARPTPKEGATQGGLATSEGSLPDAPETLANRLVQAEPGAVVRHAVAEVAPVAERARAAKLAGPRVEGEVVDEHLRPLAGAVLAITRPGIVSDPSGLDGLLYLDLGQPAEDQYDLEVRCEGYATELLSTALGADSPTLLGRIILQPTGRIQGRVVDQETLPVAAAQVFVTRPNLRMSASLMRRIGPDIYQGVLEQVSDADGSFVFDGVQTGQVRVWAGKRDALWALSNLIDVEPDAAPIEIVLRLDKAETQDVLEGIVLMPDGSPLADCTVRCDYRGAGLSVTRWATTDRDGRFSMLVLPGARCDFRAEDPKDEWSDAIYQGAQQDTLAILRFQEPRTARILVLDTEDAVIPDATVQSLARFKLDTQAVGSALPEGDGPGAFLLREPAEKFFLRVTAPKHLDFESEEFLPGDLPSPFIVKLDRLPGIHGRVLIGDQPARGVRMKIAPYYVGIGEVFQVVYHKGFLTELDPSQRFRIVTDDDGLFEFTPQEPGAYAIRAERDDYAPAELRIRDYDPTIGLRDLELRLSAGGHLEGEVLLPPGEELAGTLVAISRGDAHHRSTRVGADGFFHFENLIPGRWNVEVVESGLENLGTLHRISKEPVEPPWLCEVFEGETTYYDINLANREPCTLEGMVTMDGIPLDRWTASLLALGGHSNRPSENPQAVVAGSGNFELRVPKGGSYLLMLQSPQGEPELQISCVLGLEPGSLSWQLVIETCSIVIENVPAAEEFGGSLTLVWEGTKEVTCARRLVPDATGRCTIERFPAGKIRVVRSVPGAWNPAGSKTLLEAKTEAGQEARLVLP